MIDLVDEDHVRNVVFFEEMQRWSDDKRFCRLRIDHDDRDIRDIRDHQRIARVLQKLN
jgi:hypothetical protein